MRTLVKTTTAGWFINSDDPDGSRVRKQEGDKIISLETYEATKSNGNGSHPVASDEAKAADATPKPSPDTTHPTVISDTGKILVGKTVEIQCKWVPEDKQTDEILGLYAKDQRSVTVADVEKSLGKPKCCKVKRTIKVQDEFQVVFCANHQEQNRKRIRREKARAKRTAAKKG